MYIFSSANDSPLLTEIMVHAGYEGTDHSRLHNPLKWVTYFFLQCRPH